MTCKGMTQKKTRIGNLSLPPRPLTSPYRAQQSVTPLTHHPREQLPVKDAEKDADAAGAVDVAADVVATKEVSPPLIASMLPLEHSEKRLTSSVISIQRS